MPQRQTDNSHFAMKLDLRVTAAKAVARPIVRVVDAFAGEGHLWAAVGAELGDVVIETLAIDRKPKSRDTVHVISADNRSVLGALDYAAFDLVDLDAYGAPVDQLRLVAAHAPHLPVLVTSILPYRGPTARPILAAAGIPLDWQTKAPALFGGIHLELWDAFLASLGYTRSRRFTSPDQGMLKIYELLDPIPTPKG